MLNFYRFIKTCFAFGAVAAVTWYAANTFAEDQNKLQQPPAVEDLERQDKLLSEMTDEEKSQLTADELKSLEEFEAGLRQTKEPQAPQY